MSVVFIGIPGFCAGKYKVFSSEFLSTLSTFQLMFLEPSLVFASVAARMDTGKIAQLFPILRAGCFGLAVGAGLAYIVIRKFPCASDWTPFARVMFYMVNTFQNGGSFPLAVMQSLCNDLFHSDSHCFQDSSLIIFTYTVPWSLAMWSVGYQAVSDVIQQPRSDVEMMESQPSGWISREVSRQLSSSVDGLKSVVSQVNISQPAAFIQYPRRIAQGIIGIMNPILVALLGGIIVGCIPFLQEALFHHGGLLFVFGSSMKTVGNVVPVVGITILAASLGMNLAEHNDNADKPSSRHAKDSPVQWVALAGLGKLVLVPLLCGCWVYITTGTPFEHLIWPGNLNARLVVVLNWCAPPCLCMVVLCHKFGVGDTAMRYLMPLYLIAYTAVILTSIPFIVATFASMPQIVNDVIEDQAVLKAPATGISGIDVAQADSGNLTQVAEAVKQVAAAAAPAVAAAAASAVDSVNSGDSSSANSGPGALNPEARLLAEQAEQSEAKLKKAEQKEADADSKLKEAEKKLEQVEKKEAVLENSKTVPAKAPVADQAAKPANLKNKIV
jgi:predicted permease